MKHLRPESFDWQYIYAPSAANPKKWVAGYCVCGEGGLGGGRAGERGEGRGGGLGPRRQAGRQRCNCPATTFRKLRPLSCGPPCALPPWTCRTCCVPLSGAQPTCPSLAPAPACPTCRLEQQLLLAFDRAAPCDSAGGGSAPRYNSANEQADFRSAACAPSTPLVCPRRLSCVSREEPLLHNMLRTAYTHAAAAPPPRLLRPATCRHHPRYPDAPAPIGSCCPRPCPARQVQAAAVLAGAQGESCHATLRAPHTWPGHMLGAQVASSSCAAGCSLGVHRSYLPSHLARLARVRSPVPRRAPARTPSPRTSPPICRIRPCPPFRMPFPPPP